MINYRPMIHNKDIFFLSSFFSESYEPFGLVMSLTELDLIKYVNKFQEFPLW